VHAVLSGNIVAGKNFNNKITGKNFYGQLFIKFSLSIICLLPAHQYIEGKTWSILYLF
jgi:hypothetical protein